MLDLATEKDLEVLRQAALLLEHENQRLTAKLVVLAQQRLLAEGKDKTQLTLRLEEIERQLAATQKKLYGVSSERRADVDVGCTTAGRRALPRRCSRATKVSFSATVTARMRR